MRKITLAASLLVAPAIAHAQTTVQAQSQTSVSTSASAPAAKRTTAAQGSAATNSSVGASAGGERQLSADAQGKIDANLHVARERKLPEEPIRQRVAEGQAKGASDAQIVAASGRTLVDLQGSFDAMVRGGHSSPSDAEVSRGASLLARGYTSVQIEGIARKAPSDRSLVVAFETLTSLQARGVPNDNAVAKLESLLAARSSDAQLQGAANANAAAGLTGAVGRGQAAGNATGSASGAAATGVAGSTAAGAGAAATGALGAAASGATTGAKASGGVSGAVSGVLGKP
jgi:hypothetical protein